ncbi:adenylyltransferase/cytidyltransferase family protein [bacterium]|nr:adenylyltransferase/cytidyltransferase family protein [bacterium]
MNKLCSLSQLKSFIEEHKQKGRTVVLTNGCFDLIHVGHIRYLREAKKKGDVLVVALNSDSSVKKIKGKGRPILHQKERSEILSSFHFVDHVVVFEEPTAALILLTLKPHIHAKGSDYTEQTVPEKEIVQSYGGKVAITGGPKVKSTSQIMKEIAFKVQSQESSSL